MIPVRCTRIVQPAKSEATSPIPVPVVICSSAGWLCGSCDYPRFGRSVTPSGFEEKIWGALRSPGSGRHRPLMRPKTASTRGCTPPPLPGLLAGCPNPAKRGWGPDDGFLRNCPLKPPSNWRPDLPGPIGVHSRSSAVPLSPLFPHSLHPSADSSRRSLPHRKHTGIPASISLRRRSRRACRRDLHASRKLSIPRMIRRRAASRGERRVHEVIGGGMCAGHPAICQRASRSTCYAGGTLGRHDRHGVRAGGPAGELPGGECDCAWRLDQRGLRSHQCAVARPQAGVRLHLGKGRGSGIPGADGGGGRSRDCTFRRTSWIPDAVPAMGGETRAIRLGDRRWLQRKKVDRIQSIRGNGRNTILRLYSPLEPWFDKT